MWTLSRPSFEAARSKCLGDTRLHSHLNTRSRKPSPRRPRRSISLLQINSSCLCAAPARLTAELWPVPRDDGSARPGLGHKVTFRDDDLPCEFENVGRVR